MRAAELSNAVQQGINEPGKRVFALLPVLSFWLFYVWSGYCRNHCMETIGFGGSCHWCTEAIFQSLKGVAEVKQGWIAADGTDTEFSEAVLLQFDPGIISLETLVTIHLHTHSCTANHNLRKKYRSAIYVVNEIQERAAREALGTLQPVFEAPIITRVLALEAFRLNSAEYLNYFYSNPGKPFCQQIVKPKLELLAALFADKINIAALQQR